MTAEPYKQIGTKTHLLKVNADDVLNAIAEGCDVLIEYATIHDSLNIEKIRDRLEQDENSRLIIPGEINIRNCEIIGNVNLSSVVILKDVSFNYSIFKGVTYFTSICFSNNVSFRTAVFDNKVDFSFAVFNGHTDFISSTFNYSVDFDSVVFNNDVIFGGALFSSKDPTTEANFSMATFNGYAIFSSSSFNGSANFNHAVFNGYTHFAGSSFNTSVLFLWTAMKHHANFQGVQFHESNLRFLIWNHIICPVVKSLTLRKIILRKKIATDFSEFNTTTIMDGSSNPYLKRYIDDEQWVRSWRERRRKIWFFFWEITSHCGRSLGLWAMWSAFFAITFALIYCFKFGDDHFMFNVQQILDEGKQPDFWSYLYYSIVTFTTLGFGDIVPITNPARIAVGTEVILGYVMLGGLISIFANKLARRS